MQGRLSPFLEFGFADAVDVFVVTALVYAALALIRRTRAAFVAMGIVMLGAIYIAARALDLRLTAWIFQGFFAVLLVVLVVVFQEELRQLFERLALWSLGRSEPGDGSSDPTDSVVSCLAEFARERTGALIVLPGTQPVLRHIQGGIELGGRVSIPLLLSIFDKHSPGHDGAVLIDGDRITRFAAHLPLSKDFSQLSRRGTRHSAALGLAERTDALCLVVSEERGEISVARDGSLRKVASPQQAAAAIQQFFAEKRPTAERGWIWRPLVREHGVEKAVSLVLVIGLWYLFVPGSRYAERSFEIPVTVENIPQGFELETVEPADVTATFSGVERAFYLFRPERLEVMIDASLARLGRRTFKVTDQSITYPKELTLQELDPTRVKLSLRKALDPPPGSGPKTDGTVGNDPKAGADAR
jgi:uncharacterized protein (TIGR00159 family)